MTNIVAIEEISVPAHGVQSLLNKVGDRRFARSREAREPENAGSLALDRRARRAIDRKVLGMDVVRAAQREVQHARADGLIGEAIDDDKAAGVAVMRIRIERDRLVELELANADFVQLELLRRDMLERIHIDPVLHR